MLCLPPRSLPHNFIHLHFFSQSLPAQSVPKLIIFFLFALEWIVLDPDVTCAVDSSMTCRHCTGYARYESYSLPASLWNVVISLWNVAGKDWEKNEDEWNCRHFTIYARYELYSLSMSLWNVVESYLCEMSFHPVCQVRVMPGTCLCLCEMSSFLCEMTSFNTLCLVRVIEPVCVFVKCRHFFVK